MEINKGTIILIIFLITFMLPVPVTDSLGGSVREQRQIRVFLDEQLYQRDVLHNSTYTTGYGNLTGFRVGYADAMAGVNDSDTYVATRHLRRTDILPTEVQTKAQAVFDTDKEIANELRRGAASPVKGAEPEHAFFLNVTGSVKGKWRRQLHNFTTIPMANPPFFARDGTLGDGIENVGSRLYGDQFSGQETESGGRDSNVDDDDDDWGGSKVKIGNLSQTSGTVKINLYDIGYPEMPKSVESVGFNKIPGKAVREETGEESADTSGNTQVLENSQTSIETPPPAEEAEHMLDTVEPLESASYIALEISLEDDAEADTHRLALQGVHFHGDGNIIATTSSLKFAGVYGLPHLALNAERYSTAKELFLYRLNRTLDRMTRQGAREDLAEALKDSEKCEYIAYLHVSAVNISVTQMQDIDAELAFPVGRPHVPVPELQVSGVLYSPDCGISVSLSGMEGLRSEVFWSRASAGMLCFLVLILVQIILFIRLMNDANTQSSMSRLSVWTLVMISFVDGSLCIVLLLSSIFFDRMFIPLIAGAFLCFTLASVFEMRYMILVTTAQLNERSTAANDALNAVERAANGADTPGSPATPAATPGPSPMLVDEQQVAGAMYSRFNFALIVNIFVLLNVLTWPKTARHVYEYVMITALNCIWVPQIYRNLKRGSRRSFRWEFIIGTSVIRAITVLYVSLSRHNVLTHRRDVYLAGLVVLLYAGQIIVLALQEFFGPRFFLPDSLLPKSYEYHPVLTEDDLKHGFGIEYSDSQADLSETSETAGEVGESAGTLVKHNRITGKYQVDCPICMNQVDLVVVSSEHTHLHDRETASSNPYATSITEDESGPLINPELASNVLARRHYMVAPCRHIFHTECLEAWMKYKLQCPVCRTPLPPL